MRPKVFVGGLVEQPEKGGRTKVVRKDNLEGKITRVWRRKEY